MSHKEYDVNDTYTESEDDLVEDDYVVQKRDVTNLKVSSAGNYVVYASPKNPRIHITWYGSDYTGAHIYGVVFNSVYEFKGWGSYPNKYYDIVQFNVFTGTFKHLKRIEIFDLDVMAYSDNDATFLLINNDESREITLYNVYNDTEIVYKCFNPKKMEKILRRCSHYKTVCMGKNRWIIITQGFCDGNKFLEITFDNEMEYSLVELTYWKNADLLCRPFELLNDQTILTTVRIVDGVNVITFNINTGATELKQCTINGDIEVPRFGFDHFVEVAGNRELYGYLRLTGLAKLDVEKSMWNFVEMNMLGLKEFVYDGRVKWKPDVKSDHCSLIRIPSSEKKLAFFSKITPCQSLFKDEIVVEGNVHNLPNNQFAKKVNVVCLQDSASMLSLQSICVSKIWSIIKCDPENSNYSDDDLCDILCINNSIRKAYL